MNRIKYIIIVVFCMNINTIISQEVIISGLNWPNGLDIQENFLYFSNTGEDKISKIDLSLSTPVIIDVITGLDSPRNLCIDGNFLYVVERMNSECLSCTPKFKISQIDISNNDITELVTNLYKTEFVVKDNFLYYVHLTTNISKININDLEEPPILIGFTLAYGHMEIHDDDLYISHSNSGITIMNTDDYYPGKTDSFLSTEYLSRYFTINEDYIYMYNHTIDNFSRINFISSNNNFELLNYYDGWIPSMKIHGNYLYFVDRDGNNISKFNMSDVLSTNNNNLLDNEIRIITNQKDRFITILGLSKSETYRIYNITGSLISKGITVNNKAIDIKNYSKGLYIVKIGNRTSLKFLIY